MISICIIHIQTNSLKNVGGVGFLDIATWANWDFEVWSFVVFRDI